MTAYTTATTTPEWVQLAPKTKLTRADRESGGRGFAYIVADVVGMNTLCVTQRMPLAVGYLNELGLQDGCKTSSLYDACLRSGQLYKHRFKVVKLDLEQVAAAFNAERAAHPYEAAVVATAQPSRYGVVVGGEGL